jgi:hypothetical protein
MLLFIFLKKNAIESTSTVAANFFVRARNQNCLKEIYESGLNDASKTFVSGPPPPLHTLFNIPLSFRPLSPLFESGTGTDFLLLLAAFKPFCIVRYLTTVLTTNTGN